MKKLYRSETEKKIGGVCGGLGEYFEVDPILFRSIFVILTLLGGCGILAYLVMWFMMAARPKT